MPETKSLRNPELVTEIASLVFGRRLGKKKCIFCISGSAYPIPIHDAVLPESTKNNPNSKPIRVISIGELSLYIGQCDYAFFLSFTKPNSANKPVRPDATGSKESPVMGTSARGTL